MRYTAQNIDVERFEAALQSTREIQRMRMIREQEKAEAFFDGYQTCLDRVIDMLHCSNYEKNEVKEGDPI